MQQVHVFTSNSRFSSFDEMRLFIDMKYDEDGDYIPSEFVSEVQLGNYEPACIEAIHRVSAVALPELLSGASYGEQWISKISRNEMFNAAICVFSPNNVRSPKTTSLCYIGEFTFEP